MSCFEHPNYDDWWKATVPLPHLKNVKPAVMTVGGWFDAEDLWGALHTYKAIEDQNKASLANHLVMGPWAHGQWAATGAENLGNIYWASSPNESYHELEVNFFNHYLKDESKNDFPEAFIYMTGEDSWHEYSDWPPEQAAEKNIYLQTGGAISFSKPIEENMFTEYISDPDKPVPYMEGVHLRRDPVYMIDDQRFASRRPDVLVFETETLTEDLTLTGPVTADLYVSTTGTDADFIVKIIDVFPDRVNPPAGAKVDVPLGGYQMLVRGEVMRGKYRNSFEEPEPFVPGEITKVSFSIPDIAHKFREGHKLMIQIQSSWFPLVDRNPQKFVNIYECDEDDFQKAAIRIYHDSSRPSAVKVMELKQE
ncbi:MAG: CocE/NonD family hydrolase [Bacteroidales bacterium]|nr:CocE/NonD family hydrolase [Bacteroidales bacterium]